MQLIAWVWPWYLPAFATSGTKVLDMPEVLLRLGKLTSRMPQLPTIQRAAAICGYPVSSFVFLVPILPTATFIRKKVAIFPFPIKLG
jgi:hypothetical protein